jgi:deaminated glutathione amidase
MVSTADVDANLSQAKNLIQQAADEGAEFAVLPEYFPLISDDETDKLNIVEDIGNGPIQNLLAEMARQHGLWLMAGSMPIRTQDPQRVASSCLLYNPTGELSARYDKIHMFDVCVNKEEGEAYNESNTIVPGREVVVAETAFATLGLSICYDLRFPELYRELVNRGATIITVPSAFTYSTGKRHWEMLLCTRAVENLCFVIASGQGGQNTEKRRTWGHSMIIDPWGNILSSLDEGPGVACADLDLARVDELRASFPALQHRVIGV